MLICYTREGNSPQAVLCRFINLCYCVPFWKNFGSSTFGTGETIGVVSVALNIPFATAKTLPPTNLPLLDAAGETFTRVKCSGFSDVFTVYFCASPGEPDGLLLPGASGVTGGPAVSSLDADGGMPLMLGRDGAAAALVVAMGDGFVLVDARGEPFEGVCTRGFTTLVGFGDCTATAMLVGRFGEAVDVAPLTGGFEVFGAPFLSLAGTGFFPPAAEVPAFSFDMGTVQSSNGVRRTAVFGILRRLAPFPDGDTCSVA